MTHETVWKSTLPPEFLNGLGVRERWFYEQQDIQRQQNGYIIERLDEGNIRMDATDIVIAANIQKLKDIETLRVIITSKWSVVMSFVVLIGIPTLFIFIGVWVEKWLGTKPH